MAFCSRCGCNVREEDTVPFRIVLCPVDTDRDEDGEAMGFQRNFDDRAVCLECAETIAPELDAFCDRIAEWLAQPSNFDPSQLRGA